jgi:hypothetical protein
MLNKSEFEAELICRKIFYFSCPELNTPVPHYFICICNHPIDIVNLSCCTSQFDTVRRLIERGRFPSETLIYIPATDADNPFHKDTYVNCNEYFPYTIEELWILYYSNQLQIIPQLLPIHSFEQILIGFNASPQIEDEIKDALPSMDDL